MQMAAKNNNEFVDINSTCIIVLGMAGSGKTTFVSKLNELAYNRFKPYVINLDPACLNTPYSTNIDIRDTISYKEVMSQYKLGPNGGIVTALNLFSTKFGCVIEFLTKAFAKDHKICILDTPGQIEVFTWSASGTIITEALAASFPTVIVYVVDIVKSQNPITFMSNMLYACSILYKGRLPFIIVFNKIDVQDHSFAVEWMQDFDVFLEAAEKGETYMSSLTRSMALMLDEFYRELKSCGVSSKSGIGFGKFFELLGESVKEYESNYKEDFKANREKHLQKMKQQNEDVLSQIQKNPGGKEVQMTSFDINAVPQNEGIYIKHPGDESSEDEEGTENTKEDLQEIEDTNFNDFIKSRNSEMAEKFKK